MACPVVTAPTRVSIRTHPGPLCYRTRGALVGTSRQACSLQINPANTLQRATGSAQARQCRGLLSRTRAASTETELDRGRGGGDVMGNRPTSPAAWEIMSNSLKDAGVKFISAQELLFAQAKGVSVIDVRPEAEFNSGFIKESINVEFYRLIDGWSTWQVARKMGFAFFGIPNGTEFNPFFVEQVQQVVSDPQQSIIIVCGLGGTLEATGPSKFGRQTRSLMAAYELLTAGYANISVLKGGVNDWRKSDRPLYVADSGGDVSMTSGDEDSDEAGRTDSDHQAVQL